MNRSRKLFFSAMVIVAVGFLLLLREIFAGRLLIDPIAFAVGPLEVRWYGLIIALAILIALPWTSRRVEARGLDRRAAESAYWWAVLGGIVGARLVYVLQNLDYFTAHLDRIVALTDGGLSIHGALLGGALALLGATHFRGHLRSGRRSDLFGSETRLTVGQGESVKQFLKLTDAAVPAVLLGMILGRFGNLANAELFGPPTDLPWKLFIPVIARPTGLVDVAFYHPTFLYDALLNSILLVGLLWLEQRWSEPGSPSRWRLRLLEGGGGAPGTLTLLFFLGIATTRFLVEFWRLGEALTFGLSLAQLVSVLIALIAASLLWYSGRNQKS